MKFPRRKFLHLAAGAAALPVVSRIAGFPGPNNTGNRLASANLKTITGGVHTTSDNQVVSGLLLLGPDAFIEINHNNVTVRDCTIQGAGIFGMVCVPPNTLAPPLVEFVTIVGGAATSAGLDLEATGVEVRFCNISHCENGIGLGGPNHFYHDNYIWGLMRTDVPIDVPHFDGIQTAGAPIGTNFRIINNTIISRDTSCCIIRLNTATDTVTISNNLFGADPTLPSIPKPIAYGVLCNAATTPTGTAIVTNNHFLDAARHIFPLEFDGIATVTCTGNIDDATGQTVPPIIGPPV
jgi:hypothetical protein